MKKLLLLFMLLASSATAGGYISGGAVQYPAAFVYAFLPSPTNTTITVADIYYGITGPFNNDLIEGFVFSVDHIEYQGSRTRYFEVDWHASASIVSSGKTIHLGVKKNTDTPVGVMGTLCKTAGYAYALSGTCVIQLATDDEVQLVVTSETSGEVVTFNHFIATIRPLQGGY